MDARKRKKKVLLMGKSGSGKSSMRSIIFSNYVAKDVRRLGATIDVEHSHARFMGNLTLNLWDCGGQDAFMDSYLNSQRENVFTNAQVLIYVFDIESREVDRDLDTYSAVISALKQFSPSAMVFCLVHKMDLVQAEHRERIYEERCRMILTQSDSMSVETFASSIWDQTLYKAWAGIVHKMIPNLSIIERFLRAFAEQISAEEIVLFERSTFLTVTSVDTTAPKGTSEETANPNLDRHERISNIMKSYKHTVAKSTKGPSSSSVSAAGFVLYKVQTPSFNAFLARFTENTYIAVVVPPGEAAFNCAVLNTMMAKGAFLKKTGVEG
ncbi:GTP-binding protein gtr1 [Lithohypha guttulata]|nr:GTP-binding protein gtr1 [Lithohypha guttulata]